MKCFKNLSIRKKLSLLLMGISTAAVLAACLTFYYLIVDRYQQAYLDDLHSLANITSANCVASLAFGIPEDAEELLASLANRPSIIAATIHDNDGNLFAGYNTHSLSIAEIRADLHADSLTEINHAGNLLMSHHIVMNERKIGVISLYDDLRSIHAFKHIALVIVTTIVVAVLGLTALLAGWLKEIISRPISDLAAIAHEVSTKYHLDEKNSSPKGGQIDADELSVLSASIGEMVASLDQAFATTTALNNELEDRVEERTRELTEANAELQNTLRELKETQMQLIHSEKMAAVGQLVAGISHEMNNSINFITGALPPFKSILNNLFGQLQSYEILGKEGETAHIAPETAETMENLRLLLDNINSGAERIADICQDLRTFSYNGKSYFDQVDIHQCLDSAFSVIKHQAKGGQIELRKEYTKELPFIFGHQGQLTQVFLNIALNALQAITNSGEIVARTQIKADDICIAITDDGIGIPHEIISKIFEPFFTTKEVGKGTGLGLGICYSIMKNHGGSITINSEEGKGTQVEIMIPRSRVDVH